MRCIINKLRRDQGYLLTEIVVSIMLIMVIAACLIAGYIQAATTAEWSAYSLAAQAQSLRGLEQARAAKWDRLSGVDELVAGNFPARIEILDIPMRGDNIVYVTNFTTLSSVSATPPVKMIRVDSVWSFINRGLFTNSAFTYRAPDQ